MRLTQYSATSSRRLPLLAARACNRIRRRAEFLSEALISRPNSQLDAPDEKEVSMGRIAKGLASGAAATAALSGLMVMKSVMGVMPQLDLPKMIAGMMGAPDTPAPGWAIHAMIGIVGYGLAIALLDSRLPGKGATLHGVLIGFAGWLVMMVMLMPMAGVGLFGMALGMMAPLMTLVLHLIFGAVLGWTFGRLARSSGVHATA
jgi:hypothetical protein